jgi:hypothetical protein
MSTIRFEQAVFINKEQDKIKLYEYKFNEVVRMFTKSTLMQLNGWDLWEKVLELSEPMSKGDYSDYLFKKLDEVFSDFENLQNDKRFISLQKNISEMIEKCNKMGVSLK